MLANLRRAAPEAGAAAGHLVDHARRHYDTLPDKRRVAAAFQTLTAQLRTITRSGSPARTSSQAV